MDAIDAAFQRCVRQLRIKLDIAERRTRRRLIATNVHRERIGSELRITIRCGRDGCFSSSSVIGPGEGEKTGVPP